MEADVGRQHAAVLPAQRPDPQQAVVSDKHVKLRLDSRGDTGEAQVRWCLQVGNNAALVPQQAAMAQFDGGNELSLAGLRVIPGWKNKVQHVFSFLSRHFLLWKRETIKKGNIGVAHVKKHC